MEPDPFGLQVPVARVQSGARATLSGDDMTPERTTFDLPGNGFYCARDAAQSGAELRSLADFHDPGIVVPRKS